MTAAVDLVAVRPALQFDETALQAYLRQHLPGYASVTGVAQFAGGQSNPTFRIDTGAGPLVLRKQPPGRLLPGAHAVDREYRVLAALRDSEVPVPRVVHFCADAEVIGTPFYLMECLEGRVFRDLLLPGTSAAERSAIYAAMIETLARLHRVDWKGLGLGDFGKPQNYLARQLALWSRQYQAARREPVPAMERLMAWLTDHLPAEQSPAIAHGDYRLENLLFDAREPRVIAVLDWELATLGDPLSDLAYNCMPYHLPTDLGFASGLVGVDLAPLGIPAEPDYIAAYCAATGRAAIADWTFYQVFSLFRTAAIQHGIYQRAVQGNAPSERAREFGELYRQVAACGVALLDNGGTRR
jgi:aminoglycoside phosphotransferase (APT) family kinase protein